MRDFGDYKHGIQLVAEELTQKEFGEDTEFYDLSDVDQYRLYTQAVELYWEMYWERRM